MTAAVPARHALLVNPNSSAATTALMLDAARPHLPPGWTLRGTQAATGPAMITDAPALHAAADEVVRLAAAATDADAILVAAFGDPAVARLRAMLRIPVMGIGEAAMREAAAGNARWGIATTTPDLVAGIEALVRSLHLGGRFTGIRVTPGHPLALAADPARQAAALADAAAASMDRDGAERVVIGGGPLSASATVLRERFGPRVVAPVPAAARWLARALESGTGSRNTVGTGSRDAVETHGGGSHGHAGNGRNA